MVESLLIILISLSVILETDVEIQKTFINNGYEQQQMAGSQDYIWVKISDNRGE